MEVTVFGAGYVGLVSAICLAELGWRVICVDVDAHKIDLLAAGQLPIYERGLEILLKKNLQRQTIQFSDRIDSGILFSSVYMIAVGTPTARDGSADLSAVLHLVNDIATLISKSGTIVIKSTVPVGTAENIQAFINTLIFKRQCSFQVNVVSNPEFLKEGTAVDDFMQPDRIIIGANDKAASNRVKQLYEPLLSKNIPLVQTDTRTAEFTKYAANAFLATKISFMNEMSRLTDSYGVDIEIVKYAMGLDQRIGNKFINPGCGFGGSCFPKDLQALLVECHQRNLPADLLKAVWQVNEVQKTIIFQKIQSYFKGNLKNKVIALWGLAFKPNTDDVRSAPSHVLMRLLWQSEALIRAYDPLAMGQMREIYGESQKLTLVNSKTAALKGADVLVIMTEWDEFRAPDFLEIKQLLSVPAIFDGRNLFDAKELENLGFDYFGIGRGKSFDLTKETVTEIFL